MKVGLIDVDSLSKKRGKGGNVYPNLALAKISAYHKAQGDMVEWYDPFFGGEYDKIYMSKIFNFTQDYQEPIHAKEVIRGGTGYDITSRLPQEIDDMQPDLSIYPDVPTDTAYGFLTRGCPNKCSWCVVPRKEGLVKPYWDIDRVANGKPKVILMDNNILAAGDYAKEQLKKIIAKGYRVDFNQALDARLITPEYAELLAKIKWIDRRIRFGCDTKAQVKHCDRAMAMIDSFGYRGQYFLYTMLTSDFKECYDRIHRYWEENQKFRQAHKAKRVYPYAQPYRDPDNPSHQPPQWQKDMAQWVNKKMVFGVCDFKDFSPRKGFKCEYYLKQFNYGLKHCRMGNSCRTLCRTQ